MAKYSIGTLNNISKVGLDRLTDQYALTEDINEANGIVVRSYKMHEMDFSDNLLAIGRAGAGVNNIPLDRCADEGIVVFNTPGANSNAVKELVIAGLIMGSRNMYEGISWANTLEGDVSAQVEKGKKQFAGTEIEGKTLGIIGLGAIGALVANVAIDLGMKVIGTDPFLSVGAALRLSPAVQVAKSADEVLAAADYLTLHVPCNADTKGFINAAAIAKMKDGARVLNFARGELVNDADMIAALEAGKIACYVTDFPNANTIGVKNIIAIPHLGASTPESEDNCAMMAADELSAYLEQGNIINSVNFPNAEMHANGTKLCVLHKNVPTIIAQITSALGDAGKNIDNMVNASKKDNAYTMIDVAGDVADSIVDTVKAIDGVIRVRVIA